MAPIAQAEYDLSPYFAHWLTATSVNAHRNLALMVLEFPFTKAPGGYWGDRREQFHALRVNETLDPLNPSLREYLLGLQSNLAPVTGDPVTTEAMSVQILANLRQQQALSLSYFDVFWVFAVIAVVLTGFALLMRRSVAEKGAHLAAE